MRSIKDLNVNGKKVLLRTDFNVSMEGGEIKDDFRIKASLPTIKYLSGEGAITLILAHLGRPNGSSDDELSLLPVAGHLSKLLKREVLFFKNYAAAQDGIKNMQEGDVALYENLRYDRGEEDVDMDFAKKLAALADVYVNDAFAVSHRRHTSVYLLPKLLPSAAGLLLEKEINTFNEIRNSATRPLVFIMGGAKVETKIKLLEKLMPQLDAVCFGGLMANTILTLKGIAIGVSEFEPGMEKHVNGLKLTDTKIHLPLDVVVSTDTSGKAYARVTALGNIRDEEMILDIGPDTVKLFSDVITKAGTVFWNGPMGLFEVKAFSNGTYNLARALKDTNAKVVVGGGDVMRAIDEVDARKYVHFASTGGGAMLEYLAEGTLPGIEALNGK